MTAVDSSRREQVLETAADLFASGGIRASMREIADACGILPGSLYHHFESKEAIVVELVTRYQRELDDIADAALAPCVTEVTGELAADGGGLDPIAALGTAIAACAVRNRAALLLTYYEPPTGSGPALAELAARTPERITAAMYELLRRAAADGSLQGEVDLRILADRLCQSMLHVGIGVYHRQRASLGLPAMKCRILLEGLAVRCPTDRTLDASAARRAADQVIQGWGSEDEAAERVALIRSVARAEFGRRGYEATTIRDVAAAAGVRPGNLYRVVASKEELLTLVLREYAEAVNHGWAAVMSSDGSAIEQLDALMWLGIKALERFRQEHRIHWGSMQQSPPAGPDLGVSVDTQLRQLQRLLVRADQAGEIVVPGSSPDLRARMVFSLIWTPENLVRDLGVDRALAFDRATLLRGAAHRT